MWHEVRYGIYQTIGIVRDSARIVGSFLAAVLMVFIRSPLVAFQVIVYGPRWTWMLLRSAPPRLVVLVLALTVTAVGSLGATGLYLWREHRLEFQRNLFNRQLEHFMLTCEIEQVEEMLVRLKKLTPDDPSIDTRLDSVRTLEAPLNDPKLIRVIMRTHFRNGHYDKAAREAAKLVENFPNDWEGRCMLADEADRRGDRAAVKSHLSYLTRAADNTDTIAPWVAWYSAMLFQRLNETAKFEETVDFVTRNILPLLRSKEVALFEHDAKLLLLECYRIALTQLDRRSRLVQFWEPAQIACRSIVESDKVETRQLISVALAQQMHLEFLNEFLRRRLITQADHTAYAAEVEQRMSRAAERAMERDPKAVQPYIILAEHHFRAGRIPAAFEIIDKGLRACGAVPELIADKALLLRRTDPQAGLQFLDRTVKIENLSPMMCQVYADAALAAGRPDKALEACRQAHKTQPGLLWAHRKDAEICLMLDRPTEAAAALQPIKTYLATDPTGCELYVKTLCASGTFALAEEFLEQVSMQDVSLDVLLRGAQGFQAAGHFDKAVRWAKVALERDKTNATALLIVADGLRILAEQGARGWDLDKVRESLRAYRAVHRQQEHNLVVVNNIVWLELRALELPQQAFASSAPLRAVQDAVALPAEFMDTLGELYIAVGRLEDARKILEQAVQTAGPRASFFMHLALAHHGLGQPEMAERFLTQAAELHKTNRETAELYDIAQRIQRRK